ncbi:MAG: MlaD family protein [Alphaproteobacteria bacterium]
MRRETIEIIIGLLVILVAATPIALLAAGSRKPEATARTYVLHAHFNKVGGVQPGNEVQIGGIRVGTILRQYIDYENYSAVLDFAIDERYKLPVDTEVSVASAGMFGGGYIDLRPGTAAETILPNGTMTNTKDVKSLEDEIAAVAFGSGI